VYAAKVPSMPYFDHIESAVNIAIKINKNQHCSYVLNETLDYGVYENPNPGERY
jgi:hypothetical protein